MRGFYIRGPFATIARLDATVAFIAEILAAAGRRRHARRAPGQGGAGPGQPGPRALELLGAYAAWPEPTARRPGRRTTEPGPTVDWSQLLPAVTVYVHLYGEPDTDGIARVEGHRPGHRGLDPRATWARRRGSPSARSSTSQGQAPVDAYEIPDRHRQAVHLMTPADTFPFSSNTSRSQQVDHTEPYEHGAAAEGAGQSRVGNYGPMTILHHRIKTHGRWQVQQPFPGIYVWRDPYGALLPRRPHRHATTAPSDSNGDPRRAGSRPGSPA